MKMIWLFTVSAILAIGVFMSAPAEAGKKKLNFGGPLGSFEATPHAKGSNRGHSSHSKKRSSKAAARRRAAKKKKAAARKAAARRAAAKKRAAQKRAATKRAASKRATARAKTNKKVTVSKAATNDEVEKSAPVKASAIAATNTLKFRPEPPPEKGADEGDAAKTETADAATDPYECKKYIPSAGMTVSVPCGPDP